MDELKVATYLLGQVSKFLSEIDTDYWPPVLDLNVKAWLVGRDIPAHDDPDIVEHLRNAREKWQNELRDIER